MHNSGAMPAAPIDVLKSVPEQTPLVVSFKPPACPARTLRRGKEM